MVLCDTSCIQYLHQLSLLHLLPTIYGRVTVSPAVAEEISTGRSRGITLPVLKDLPWVEVKLTSIVLPLPPGVRLGSGETEVLSLAMESPGCLVVIDDRLARQYARQLRIRLTGTLGVLLEAKRRKLIPAIRLRSAAVRRAPPICPAFLTGQGGAGGSY